MWTLAGFAPNESQRKAIEYIDGPLYLPAGPGSGKTRVLLWRTLNLIVFHGIAPEEIYLSTFTEKAARQLREGLRAYLGLVTAQTGQPFDIAKMYVGTVHSLCQRLLLDRRFYQDRQRGRAPSLLDDLDQYFHVFQQKRWQDLVQRLNLGEDPNQTINRLFDPSRSSSSRHKAATNAIALFNRISEECLESRALRRRVSDPILAALVEMYERYLATLHVDGQPPLTDFSMLQQHALNVLNSYHDSCGVFKHVIVDEYQDTNTIQERIFFRLAAGHKNICVVGDDDQALYRFRGATVENFVQFPERCKRLLGATPRAIPLATNYRSRRRIVDFYTDFITRCDWRRSGTKGGAYRVATKEVRAHSTDQAPSVVATSCDKQEDAFAEIATLVKQLIEAGKVQDPNQIAFLFPSLKSTVVKKAQAALEARGLRVYAPRANTFLDVEESVALFGVFLHIFDRPARGHNGGVDYDDFFKWIAHADTVGEQLIKHDPLLRQFVADRRVELETAADDYTKLMDVVTRKGWDTQAPYDITSMKRALRDATGLSPAGKRLFDSAHFEKIVRQRAAQGRPFSLGYMLTSATSIDWNVLDLFYRLCGFKRFQGMFDLAERGEDEGPICNMGLISQYLARFVDNYGSVIRASLLIDGGFRNMLFMSFLFALYRRGEAEYESAEDPFPKGRIPFLTIHQAKGLEFPVVVLGNPRKKEGVQAIERLLHDYIDRDGEPLDRMGKFDAMRTFYVALSRAKNLLIIADFKGAGSQGPTCEPFFSMLKENACPRIPQLHLSDVPAATIDERETPGAYSYTADYMLYKKCPRQYMIFRKYGFVASRSQTMMFGSLVHRTLDDLHQYLISQRSAAVA